MLKTYLERTVIPAMIGAIMFITASNASAYQCDTGWQDNPEPEFRISCLGYKFKLNVGWYGYVWLQERYARYGDYWLRIGTDCASATGSEKETMWDPIHGEDMYWTVAGCPSKYPTLWEGKGQISDTEW